MSWLNWRRGFGQQPRNTEEQQEDSSGQHTPESYHQYPSPLYTHGPSRRTDPHLHPVQGRSQQPRNTEELQEGSSIRHTAGVRQQTSKTEEQDQKDSSVQPSGGRWGQQPSTTEDVYQKDYRVQHHPGGHLDQQLSSTRPGYKTTDLLESSPYARSSSSGGDRAPSAIASYESSEKKVTGRGLSIDSGGHLDQLLSSTRPGYKTTDLLESSPYARSSSSGGDRAPSAIASYESSEKKVTGRGLSIDSDLLESSPYARSSSRGGDRAPSAITSYESSEKNATGWEPSTDSDLLESRPYARSSSRGGDRAPSAITSYESSEKKATGWEPSTDSDLLESSPYARSSSRGGDRAPSAITSYESSEKSATGWEPSTDSDKEDAQKEAKLQHTVQLKEPKEKLQTSQAQLRDREDELERQVQEMHVEKNKWANYVADQESKLKNKQQQLDKKIKHLGGKEKGLNTREEQLNEKEEQLNGREEDLHKNEERKKKQLETITRQNEEILSQTERIKHLTKMKEEKEEEMKKDDERIKEQTLQIERNSETLETHEEKLQMLKTAVQNMEKQREREKELIHREKQWIDEEREALKTQWTEIEEEKDKIQTQERVNKEEINRQEMDKLKNEEEIKTQTALIQKLKKEINECEEVLKKQKNMKEVNEREIERQSTQLQEQSSEIQTQKEEIDRQQMDKLKNAEEIKTQTALIQKLKKEINECEDVLKKQKNMKQINEREIERQITQLQEQSSEIQTQKGEIDRQQMDKLKNAEEIKTQTALIQKQKEEINKCEEVLQKQKNMKEVNEREIERQTTQLQEQSTEIQTQKEELDRQETEIQTNRYHIREARRKKKMLKKNIQTEEKELQMKNETFQKQLTELERLKELHEENVRLKRFEDEQNKYREMRRREEDLETLQDFHYQLDTRLSSSNYMQDCNTERDLSVELGKIIEKIKTELQSRSEEMEVLINTQEEREKRKDEDNRESDEQDDATQVSTDTGGATMQKHKVTEENMPPKDSQSIIRTSKLKILVEVLQSLGLDNFYPNKLTIQTFLSIDSTNKEQSDSNAACVYLQKLLMLNYRVRFKTEKCDKQDYVFANTKKGKCDQKKNIDVDDMSDDGRDNDNACRVRCESTVKEVQPSSEGDNVSNKTDNFDEVLSERDDSSNATKKENIHPMDVQMAVFHCADSFLRQNMVTKLSSCQYALPLLVPSPTSTDIELPLWTFRQIKKTWKSVGGSSTSLPVCQVKAPMAFFCRLGSVSTSKSQLLNSLINPKHDTFFHRDSPGSSSTRLFMEGLVEIAWYCPAGNTDDLFSECTAFCNLHGDAAEHREQTDFLTEQAAVNVVLMQHVNPNEKERELLEKLHKSSKPFIWVVCDLQRGPLKISHGLNIKIGLGGRNHNELSDDLTTAIKTCLQRHHFSPSFSLEESSDHAKRHGFRVDEDSKDCQEGKAGAQEIMNLLEGENISEIKNKFLPCQGKLWHEWSKKNKELHRFHGDEHSRSDKLKQMNAIRGQQHSIHITFIKGFLKKLQSNIIPQKRYFIQWIRHFIDAKFSDQVSQLHLKYNSKWLEVQKLKNTPGKSEELKLMQEQLEYVSGELDIIAFGVEHIFREMGQIYEAWSTTAEEMGAEVSALPAVAADLLISGHPLELMDGDAAHVPLTWIESVLDKVTETLGDQRVFVLSVLGLQSSGKSTMLNTMFGLQFAVSAGRCTRGAFMQLISVKEEVKEELKFDYLLVVDTEGLRSLKLVGKQSGLTHDNELATFVIGLANMTLINIFGENPAEIQEILQIVIQAILRMKKVKLNPSCMFVHQNITDLTAAEKNMEGRRRLQEKLDEITVSVAKEEKCDVEYFTNVIKFNIQTDVHYFAPLWEGDPPMAPPNPRYSESAESLKQAVLTAASQQKALRFSEFKVHIRDLWTAGCVEDFVFNFKNSLDFELYRKKTASKH